MATKVYALQYSIFWEDKPKNQQLLREELDRLRPQPGSLVVLPELSCTGFTMSRQGIAEDPGGETQTFYSELALAHQVYLIGGASWWGDSQEVAVEPRLGRNMALIHNPQGQLIGQYAKQHPFSYGGETRHYQPGSDFFRFDWNGCQVGPLICYDLRFPESFRHLALAGVQFFVVIANWPSARVFHWDTLLQARAIENQAYVLGVNRAGEDPKVSYPGSTRLIDPQGKVVFSLDDQPGCLQAELDLVELEAYRARFPALADVRREQLGL